jgi:hypothetical protein
MSHEPRPQKDDLWVYKEDPRHTIRIKCLGEDLILCNKPQSNREFALDIGYLLSQYKLIERDGKPVLPTDGLKEMTLEEFLELPLKQFVSPYHPEEEYFTLRMSGGVDRVYPRTHGIKITNNPKEKE